MIHTLTYWCCVNYDGSQAYNIRERTRHEAAAARAEYGAAQFSNPFKVVVRYHDALDLVIKMLGEGGGEREP